MDEKQYLSKEKFKELEKELKFLYTEKRKELAEKLEFAKSLGDLSENAEYQEARNEQAHVEDRIIKLEAMLKGAEIISKSGGEVISIGSVVTVNKDGKKQEYTIVGSEESDTFTGKISNKSPLGECLIGRSKGDKVICNAPGGSFEYKILDIK